MGDPRHYSTNGSHAAALPVGTQAPGAIAKALDAARHPHGHQVELLREVEGFVPYHLDVVVLDGGSYVVRPRWRDQVGGWGVVNGMLGLAETIRDLDRRFK